MVYMNTSYERTLCSRGRGIGNRQHLSLTAGARGTAAIRGPSGVHAARRPQGCPSSHHSFLGFISRLTVQRFANLSAFEYACEMSK